VRKVRKVVVGLWRGRKVVVGLWFGIVGG